MVSPVFRSSLRSLIRRSSVVACLVAVCAAPASAQPGGRGPASSLEFAFSHSAKSDADLPGRPAAGKLAVDAWSVSGKTARMLRPGVFASAGGTWERYEVDASSALPVPKKLQGAALNLAVAMALDADWMLSLTVSPGFYAAGSSPGTDGFNAPGLLLGTRKISPTFSVAVGLRFDAFSDNSVLPIAGFRWQPTPEWTVSLGAPRTEAVYKIREGIEVFGGGSFQGGGFAIDDPQLRSSGTISLRDTYVDYREIRAGGGLRWALGKALSLELEGGWVVDRRFDYYERSLEVKTDGASFWHVGLTTRF
ncbi:MAG: hypothetical protein FJ382_08255 [Verrucomicrobia bacterium]|nr:hypothetical protein [Verrucomicrobiota bacterium]